MRMVALLFIAVSSLMSAQRVLACGGLFCSATSPSPVDQAAERILFEVLDDGSVAATVEIKYQGDPSAFSWIVPVGGTPQFVEVAPKDILNLLDTATRPQILPPTTVCSHPQVSASEAFGCEERVLSAPQAASEGEGDAVLNDAKGGGGGVNVTEYASVGPYDDIVVVDGDDPQTLMTWLSDNGYQVTEPMRPFIEAYTREGYSFLATKLLPTAGEQDMVPIRFHCPMPYPEIPLRLTAIAAEPQMGFLVFVVAEGRYQPANYAEMLLDKTQLQTANGVTNYLPLVSKRIDDEGGRGFVLERAEPSTTVQTAVENTFLGVDGDDEAHTALNEVLSRRVYVNRFYGRLDPDEMTEDPQWVPAPGAGRFDGVHDLSSRIVDLCPSADEPALAAPVAPPCGTLYCGDGDSCGTDKDGNAGCVCGDNHVARSISAPGGGRQVACASPEIDLHGGTGVCTSHDCGLGFCIPVNDRATCSCDDDAVAVLDNNGNVTCKSRKGDVFAPDQLLWPTPRAAAVEGCAAPTGNRAGGSLSLLLLLATPLVLRAVRRRSTDVTVR